MRQPVLVECVSKENQFLRNEPTSNILILAVPAASLALKSSCVDTLTT